MLKVTSTGDYHETINFLKKLRKNHVFKQLDRYGQKGVQLLSEATPVRTGLTASSWDYRIEESPGNISLLWFNTNINKGVSIAFILQYGHGTGTGGYVQGIDYINPVMQPLFDEIEENVWGEVARL